MAIDGKPVEGQDSLSNALSRRRAGDTMELTVYRNGRTVKVKVNLDAAPEDRV